MKNVDPTKVQVIINHRGEVGIAFNDEVLVLDVATAERIGCALLKAVGSRHLVQELGPFAVSDLEDP